MPSVSALSDVPSSELARRAVEFVNAERTDDMDYGEIMVELHARGGDAEFALGTQLSRGEALVGLATKGDARGIEPLLKILATDDVWTVHLDAAREYANPILLPGLRRLREAVTSDDNASWVANLNDAIAACESPAGPVK